MYFNKVSLLSQLFYIFSHLKSTINFAIHFQKKRFKQTVLGRVYVLLSSIILVSIISIIWSIIFNNNYFDHFFYLFLNLNIWWSISQIILESPKLYINYRSILLNVNKPILQFNLFLVVYHFLNLLINLPLIVIFYCLISNDFNLFNLLIFFFNIILCFVFLFFVSIFFSILNLFFRDLEHLIKILIPLITLITPILWSSDKLGKYSEYLWLNPFAIFIDTIRLPLLSDNIDIFNYIYIFSFLILFIIGCSLLIKKFGDKLVFKI